jgi:hypothetical protein
VAPSGEGNPYGAPRNAPNAAGIEWRRGLLAFYAWLIGASALAGVLSALTKGQALKGFGGETHLTSIIAVEAFLSHSPSIAATAGALASFAGTHQALESRARTSVPRGAGAFFLFAPPSALLAGMVNTACGVLIAAAVFGVPLRSRYGSSIEILRSWDFLVCLGKTTAHSVPLAIVVPRATSALAHSRLGLMGKTIAILALAIATNTIVSIVYDAAFPGTPRTSVVGGELPNNPLQLSGVRSACGLP